MNMILKVHPEHLTHANREVRRRVRVPPQRVFVYAIRESIPECFVVVLFGGVWSA